MPISTVTAIQGQGVSYTQTLSSSTFQGTETLTASVSTGGTATALLTLTPTWASGQTTGSYGRVSLAFTSAQTASLTPGYYVVQTSLADSTSALAWALLEVVAAAGQSPTYDWLTTPAEVLGLVPDLVSTENLADLPRAIGAATDSIRRYCNRWFTRRTMTKEFTPNIYGQVRLDEIPVNAVTRIATTRDNAIQVKGPSSAQLASVKMAFTGDYDSGITVTGLTLTSTASAVTTTTTLSFSTYTTITALAAAIRAVSGWSATVSGNYGSWPTSELVGLDAAQGALTADGAWLDVYSEDASLERLHPETGMLWLRTGYSSLDSPAWGPTWMDAAPSRRVPTRVKITYDAGYTTLPSPVVIATIETVQALFGRMATDQVLQSEHAADYSYTLKDQIDFLPDSVKHALAPYRIHNA